jgi:hypothetical protein
MKQTSLLLLLALSFITGHTSAVRGFQAYSTHLSGNTYSISGEVYVRSTAPGSGTIAVQIGWDDGTTDNIDIVPTALFPSMNLSMAPFTIQHTFPASGSYDCQFSISNWDAGIINMTDATNQSLTASLQIVISPLLGPNRFNGYNFNLTNGTFTADDYTLNLLCTEPDGDNIVIEQQAVSGQAVPTVYQFPFTFGGTESITGGIYHFDNIVTEGAYAVSFVTKEFRSGILIASHVREYVFDYPEGLAGVRELSPVQQLLLYPNPCTQNVNVRTQQDEPFAIYDLQGQQVLNGTTNQSVSVASLSKGIYLVKTTSGLSQKLVKD